MPADIEGDPTLMNRLEALRQAAAVAMGVFPDFATAARMVSIPKVVLLWPKDAPTISGRV